MNDVVRCSGTIEGPPINANGNPAWRRKCKRRVRLLDGRASAYCKAHAPKWESRK